VNLPFRPAALTAVLLVVTACASNTNANPTTPVTGSPIGSGRLDVLPTIVSTELGVGPNRIIVSVLDPTGTKPAGSPDRKVSVAFRGPGGETIPAQPSTFIWAIQSVVGVYVLHATFPFDVKARTDVLAPGDPAPSVATPTIASVGGDVTKVSTDTKPVARFYETSEADALAAKKPFVLIFATPKFCKSSVCGPTLEKLKPVAAAHPEMTFINVEPYLLKDDQGQLQPVLDASGNLQAVPATVDFKLSSEPFVFVVGADGKISSSFELVFSPDEIDAAIKAVEKG
jgi:hypothetical protein